MKLTLLAAASIALFSCSPAQQKPETSAQKVQYTPEQIAAESAKANAFFDRIFDENIERSPEYQAYMGIQKNNDKWDDITDEFAQQGRDIKQKELAALKSDINYAALNEQTRLSYDLMQEQLTREIADFSWRFHNYPVNQMFGLQSNIPSFLINVHPIHGESDAMAYTARLVKVEALLDQLISNLKTRQDMGIVPPKFVFDHVIRDAQNISSDSTIIDDFVRKVEALDDVEDDKKQQLIHDAKQAIEQHLVPGYNKLIAYLTGLKQQATTDDGVWKFPNGDAFYANRIKYYTSTDLTPEQVHQIGLDEVARIHDEMRGIMQQVGFDGSLQDFFTYMREDEQFYLPNTDAGREQYLTQAKELVDVIKSRLDELFITKPKADMIVKRVEPFREKSAGKAFYNQPAPDGSRPGTYYANLYNMAEMPTYQMKALAYHEGIPGHHMQIAIAQELTGIPKFRKFGHYSAYIEGWGLYSEFTPKEMGLYDDPYDDFGRLAMELWRACRLVVDTGIHYKHWTREQGLDYYVQNTPNPEGDAVKMVERHIVMPGQATAYKIGMLKILELRKKAKQALGDQFDIREYHDQVLKNGALPLNVLEAQIDKWITTKKPA
ncbi:DUF885 domain-containing protein [Neptunicella marina]|uniref:DUF885 domain-containing protein n=1 Tax=Neptunicella marina TaxID=2125989 RepID=A0A8J6IQ87_9ALTE|nr:DUF885 domain-containing protein [Neptunicella marina]